VPARRSPDDLLEQMTPALILASTSRYRRELLARLRLDFEVARPDVDESALPGESPSVLARRLASAKAAAIAAQSPQAWVIGSDQVADLDGRALGKSGGREAAIAQLQEMSDRAVAFRTAVCVMRGEVSFDAFDTTLVRFRNLDHAEIERYVDAELPFDCAGSFKSEGLGIALFDAIETQDPTALIGLPMIATARLLRNAGFLLP
jgi:septum formation protein